MKRNSTRPLRAGLLWSALAIAAISAATAMPLLMDRYNEHPQSLPKNRDQCVICHVYQDGSGPLTSFGKKYDRKNLEFAPSLVAEYPNLFQVDGSPVVETAGTDGSESPSTVAVPGNEPFDARKYYLSECKECHGKYGDGDPFQGVPAFATEKWLTERSGDTESLVNIILNGKDKMIGQAGKITNDDAHELLDLIRLIAKKYS